MVHVKQAAQEGFTLVEALIVMAVLSVVVLVGIGLGQQLYPKNQLTSEVEQLASTLRQAQAKTVAGRHNTVWSLELTTTDYTLYAGDDYLTRDTTSDTVYAVPPGIEISGITSVTFVRGTGGTSDTGTITVTQLSTNDQRDIEINAHGRVAY